MDNTKVRQANPHQPTLSIKINYDSSIRSIDLENILSGFRLIFQHELAQKTKKSPRAFTDVTKIESIEKGSIIINIIFDINVNLGEINFNLLPIDINLINIILLYLFKHDFKETDQTIKVSIDGIKSALKHVKSIILKEKDKTVELQENGDGDIEASNKE